MSKATSEQDSRVRRLMWLTKTRRESANERRRYEIKFLFAALTLFVLVAAAFLTGQASLKGAANPQTGEWLVLVWLAFALLTAATTLYLGGIHISNSRDLRLAHWAEEQVRKITCATGEVTLDVAPEVSETNLQLRSLNSWLSFCSRVRKETNYSWRFQTLLLATLGVIAGTAVTLAVLASTGPEAFPEQLKLTPRKLSLESGGMKLNLDLDNNGADEHSQK